jgi:protein required for attachment to host cells
MQTTWILAGDASRARILTPKGKNRPWELVEEFDHPPGRARVSELVTGKPGRVFQSGGHGHASMTPESDPTDVEAEKFARQLAARLERGFDAHEFARLVLVAPPRFIGILRKSLKEPVARCVTASIPKDLTHLEIRDLQQHVEGSL